MDITKQREVIWGLIEAGGPTSVIVKEEKEMNTVSSMLLNEFSSDLTVKNIIPVCINCKTHSNPLVFFKNVFNGIWEFISSEQKKNMKMFLNDIEEAQDTSTIDAIMDIFLDTFIVEMNLNILLILDFFDELIVNLEEPDLMKIRGWTSHINMLTISHKPLETLATENNQEDYFCNQFVNKSVTI